MITNAPLHEHRGYGFGLGLLAGTFLGAGLLDVARATNGFRAAPARGRFRQDLGERASDKYRQASTHAAEAIDELTRRGQDARDDVAGCCRARRP